MNVRDTAAVVSALRYMQRDMSPEQTMEDLMPEHWESDPIKPMTAAEIDDLCERLRYFAPAPRDETDTLCDELMTSGPA